MNVYEILYDAGSYSYGQAFVLAATPEEALKLAGSSHWYSVVSVKDLGPATTPMVIHNNDGSGW